MSINKRHKDGQWTIPDNADGTVSMEGAQLAVLMDIRDELRTIRVLAGCHRVPRALNDLNDLGKWARRRKPKRKKRV